MCLGASEKREEKYFFPWGGESRVQGSATYSTFLLELASLSLLSSDELAALDSSNANNCIVWQRKLYINQPIMAIWQNQLIKIDKLCMVNMSNYILWLSYFRKPNHSKKYDFNYNLGQHNKQHSVRHDLQLNVENDWTILEILPAISTHTLPFTQLEERLRTTLLNWSWSYSTKKDNDHAFLTKVAKLLNNIWRQVSTIKFWSFLKPWALVL